MGDVAGFFRKDSVRVLLWLRVLWGLEQQVVTMGSIQAGLGSQGLVLPPQLGSRAGWGAARGKPSPRYRASS